MKHLSVFALVLCCSPLIAQQVTPPVKNPVAIANTNSSFTPTHEQIPEAVPARPTVSIPAHLPPVGYLQLEQGFTQADGSPDGVNAQSGLSQTTKISLTTRLLVQFSSQPYAYSRTANVPFADQTSNDSGDLLLGGLAVLHKSVGAVPVVDVGYIHRVRSGNTANLDIGSYSQSALFLFSGDLPGSIHYDSNIVFNEQPDGPVRRAQYLQALAFSRSLLKESTNGRLSGIVELSHATQPLVHTSGDGIRVPRANAVDLIVAATFALRPNLVVDAAFGHGLTSTSTQWQGTFGITYLIPRRLFHNGPPVPIPVGPYHYRNQR